MVLVKFVIITVFGLILDLLGALYIYWAGDGTGIEAIANLSYWNCFWITFIFTGLVSLAMAAREIANEIGDA